MKIAMQVNFTRDNAYEVALGVIREFEALNVEVLLDEKEKAKLDNTYVTYVKEENLIKDCDILLAIGGDGSIIHSAHEAVKFDKPILGINAGRLGFLAGLEKEELSLLSNLITGKYTIDKRMMLSVKYYENDNFIKEYRCLNDVVIARGISLKLCEIEAKCDGKLITNYLADGLIVATPTGSTAYSLSSGGPVVDTAIESMMITPVCSHSLFSRSIIIKPESEIQISINNHLNCRPIFSCDGEEGVELSKSSKLLITKADVYTKIIRIKSESFADVLFNKLIERYDRQQGGIYEKEQA